MDSLIILIFLSYGKDGERNDTFDKINRDQTYKENDK
jgi:hypothetical protein